MSSSSRTMSFLVFAVVLLATATTRFAEAQSSTVPSCASKLTPCASYLNATAPPESCCKPLGEAVSKELPCLCNLFNTPGLLKAFGININDALSLAARCKIPGDVNSCVKASVPGSAPTANKPSPASPGTGSSKSGVAKTSWTGMSLVLLFLSSVTVLH